MDQSLGNIKKTEFIDTLPSGRKLKHGGLGIYFVFGRSMSEVAARADVENFMEDQGYVLGQDYNIPAWNFDKYGKIYDGDHSPYIRTPLTITFANEETFIMAKMAWGIESEE